MKYQNTRKRRISKYKNKTIRLKKRFNNSHYNSGDGMLTKVWGPSLWLFLHTISFNYPVNPDKKDKKNYRDFIISLRDILPCRYCRQNLKTNFKSLPMTNKVMKNRETFSRYIYDLHEHINKMLGKKSNLSFDEVRERYERFRSRCNTKKSRKHKYKFNKTVKNKKEKGCTDPLHGKKAKCVIHIVPAEKKCNTFNLDKKLD